MASPGIGASFENDMSSWYFGPLSRADATRLLLSETESGVFLVRDSKTIQGDYVLCVRENARVSHYIINRVVSADNTIRYRIGDQIFTDMPALLGFYRMHYLDATPLVRPLPQIKAKASVNSQQPNQVLEVVVAKFDFDGRDLDDLPFRRGERLMVVNRDEEQWWTARNQAGHTGSIPVPYVQRILDANGQPLSVSDAVVHLNNAPQNNHPPSTAPRANIQMLDANGQQFVTGGGIGINNSHNNHGQVQAPRTNMQRILPALARVRQTRVPNAYDKTALKLEEGDIVKVTKININGQWEGELNGKVGHFPFTHVEFLDDNSAS